MPATQRTARWTVFVGLLVQVVCWAPAAFAQDPEAVSAKTWVGREAEIEAFLKTAEVLEMGDIPVGVTSPEWATLEPGGPVDKIAWKQLTPGRRRGFWESYKAEIAAYELDKLLSLGMVPVTVERRIEGDLGAAIMWLDPTQSFKDLGGTPRPPNRFIAFWTIQLIRAKMFDNLIYNQDPNEGNWLVDPAWNLMLIDHSRSFEADDDMAHEDMNRIDRYLWERMQLLDEPTLTEALGEWLSDGEIRGVLERRDKMGEIIDELVEKDGESAVLLRWGTPPGAEPAAPARAAGAPPGDDLLDRLVAAGDQAPIVMPSSELTWTGSVVELAGYQGRYAHVAEAGRRAGHTIGLLVAADEGMLCLTATERDAAPFDRLAGARRPRRRDLWHAGRRDRHAGGPGDGLRTAIAGQPGGSSSRCRVSLVSEGSSACAYVDRRRWRQRCCSPVCPTHRDSRRARHR